ncbi:MAG: hypothetical protein ACI85Q_000311, partial [Salibacteraceae bacterium]
MSSGKNSEGILKDNSLEFGLLQRNFKRQLVRVWLVT